MSGATRAIKEKPPGKVYNVLTGGYQPPPPPRWQLGDLIRRIRARRINQEEANLKQTEMIKGWMREREARTKHGNVEASRGKGLR